MFLRGCDRWYIEVVEIQGRRVLKGAVAVFAKMATFDILAATFPKKYPRKAVGVFDMRRLP